MGDVLRILCTLGKHSWVTNWTRLPFPNHLFFVRQCSICPKKIFAVESANHLLIEVPEVNIDNPEVLRAMITIK